jgi:hypothetical protein
MFSYYRIHKENTSAAFSLRQYTLVAIFAAMGAGFTLAHRQLQLFVDERHYPYLFDSIQKTRG